MELSLNTPLVKESIISVEVPLKIQWENLTFPIFSYCFHRELPHSSTIMHYSPWGMLQNHDFFKRAQYVTFRAKVDTALVAET
jgi:hypothetical protein